MRMKTLLLVVSVLVLPGNMTNALENAPTDEAVIQQSRRNSLKGLVGVYTRISPLDQRVKRVGLTAALLREDVESRLRAVGIPVFSTEEGKTREGQAYINLSVSIVEPRDGLRAYGIRLTLIQNVYLERNSDRVFRASTWAINATGYFTGHSPEAIRAQIRALVKRFTEDFHAINNPKPSGNPPVFMIKYDGPLEACKAWEKDEDYIHKLTWDYSKLLVHFSKSEVTNATKNACRDRVSSQREFEVCVACVRQIIGALEQGDGNE